MWAEVCSRQSKMGEEVSVMKGEKKKKVHHLAPQCRFQHQMMFIRGVPLMPEISQPLTMSLT